MPEPVTVSAPAGVAAMSPRRRPPARPLLVGLVAAIPVVAILAFPAISSNGFIIDVATDMTLWATLAIGLNAVLGWAGLLDLGFIAFFAIGGYAYAILSSRGILQFWSSLVVGIALSATAALIIGVPSLRLKSDYLAIMTLGFGEIVYIAAKNLPKLTGGNNGMFGYAPPSIGGFQFESTRSFYLLGLGLLLVCGVVSGLTRRTRVGRSWMSLRDDELSAQSIGISVWRSKLYAYLYGSVWGTLAGAVFAAKQTIVSPTSFSFDQSFYVLSAVVIGGMASVWGSAVGGVVYILISEGLQGVKATWSGVIFSGAMLAVILLRPEGLTPLRSTRRLLLRAAGVGTGTSAVGVPGLRPARADRGAAVLSAGDVRVRYGGVVAVDGVSFRCETGQVVALIGSNGAGKTTLLNAMSGFAPVDSGVITRTAGADRLDLTRMSPARRARRGIARTFQTPRLSRDDTVWENIVRGTLSLDRSRRVPARSSSRRREGRWHADHALELTGLRPLAQHPAGELSYGDQRRCEIARAVAGDPDFLLLDEPSSGMNDAETADLAELVRTLAGEGLGMVMVEHDMNLVTEAADVVVAMDVGQVIAHGSAEHVLSSDDVRSRYLGE